MNRIKLFIAAGRSPAPARAVTAPSNAKPSVPVAPCCSPRPRPDLLPANDSLLTLRQQVRPKTDARRTQTAGPAPAPADSFISVLCVPTSAACLHPESPRFRTQAQLWPTAPGMKTATAVSIGFRQGQTGTQAPAHRDGPEPESSSLAQVRGSRALPHVAAPALGLYATLLKLCSTRACAQKWSAYRGAQDRRHHSGPVEERSQLDAHYLKPQAA